MPPHLSLAATALAGFLAVAGSFGAGLALALGKAPEPRVTTEPAPPQDATAQVQLYYPLPEPLHLSLTDGRTAIVRVVLSVTAPPDALLVLQATAKDRQADLMATLLQTAQAEADANPDPTLLRDGLRQRLAARLNERLGTQTLPRPVTEVLLSDFLLR